VRHRHPQDGNPEKGLFQDDPDRPGDDHAEDGAVEEAQVIGHKNVPGPWFDALAPRNFDPDPQETAAATHRPLAEGDQRVAMAREKAENNVRGDEDEENRLEDAEDERAHGNSTARL
jgi:hypothetical protein